MRTSLRRRRLLGGTALVALVLATASATSALSAPGAPPAVFQAVDENGVDLTTGEFVLGPVQASVGQAGEGGLQRLFSGSGLRDNLSGTINADTDELGRTVYTVTIGGASASFLEDAGGVIIPYAGAEAQTLTHDATARTFTHTAADGTVAVFTQDKTSFSKVQANTGLILTLTRPNGERLSYAYQAGCSSECRTEAVTSNLGYMVKYEYSASSPLSLTRVTAVNLAQEYCNPNATSCSAASWTSTGFSGPGADTGFGDLLATDSLGRTTTYTYDNGRVAQVRLPSGNTVIIGHLATGETHTVSTAAGTWTYDYVELGQNPNTHVNDRQVTVTDPLGHARVYGIDGFWNRVVSSRDALNRTTTALLDPNGRVRRVTLPEGNFVDYGYDGRGNVQTITRSAKPGSGLPARVTTLSYDATCANPKTCNQPNYVIDAGARTDFTYDPNHGGVLTVTEQAGANAVRPQTRYSYTALNAWYLSAPGVLSAGPGAVYKLTGASACMTGAACAGTADETRTTFSRGTPGVANNLQVSAVTQGDGTGTLSATTAYAYNRFGDLRTVDGPLGGTGDTARLRYDNMRQLVGRVEADPDGPSTGRPALASKLVYTPDGELSYVQFGSVPSQSDSDWDTAFSKIYTHAYVRDGAGRIVQDKLNDSAGATQSLTQYSYSGHRLDCAAVRMNPAAFASLPASACGLGAQGANGPDRVSQYGYSLADEVTSVTEALGTADARTEATTYTANGQVQTVQDGQGNLTTFEYDGHDRLAKTRFPSPTTAGQSSTSDYVQLTYDEPTWNLTGERRRDGQSVTFGYDARHRLTSKSAPVPTTFGYDNLDRQTALVGGGQSLANSFDALNRQTAATGWAGTVASQYDLAGRRTRLTWPDGYYVTYDYDLADNMTAIKEAGATVLATFGYDGFGRRTSLTRGNGAITGYGYDSFSRITSLSLDLAGTANDLSRTFTYNAAGQVLTRTNSNTAYSLRDRASGKTYAVNGLNELTSFSGLTTSNDARGNLTSDGTSSFAYDLDNRLTSAAGTALAYDPAGRLDTATSGGTATRFAYDGTDAIAEYAGGVLQQHYVHGPDIDEPIAAVNGGTRSWLAADERGSVIAQTNASGGLVAANIYDEFGVPGATNQGRFQYTGQMQLPGVLLYHYKNRAYSPVLARFLQTDPIGYAGGLNLYAYVDDDPLNLIDPLGTQDNTVSEVVVTGKLADQKESSLPFELGTRPQVVSDNEVEGVTVTAAKPRPRDKAKKLLLDTLSCGLQHYGLDAFIGAAGAGALYAGSGTIAKSVVRPGESSHTSIASKFFRGALGDTKIPFGLKVPAPTMTRLLSGGPIRATTSLGVALGRYTPVVGAALLAYDVISISVCVYQRND